MSCLSIYFLSGELIGYHPEVKYILPIRRTKDKKNMEKLDIQEYIKEQREFCASVGAETSTLTMEQDDVIVTLKLKFKHI